MRIVLPASLFVAAAVTFVFALHHRSLRMVHETFMPGTNALNAGGMSPAPGKRLASTVGPPAGAKVRPVPAQPESLCNEQRPQPFLIRSSYLKRSLAGPAETAKRKALHDAAVRYRTERYGYFRGFGRPEWNGHEPTHYGKDTTFFGLDVRMHERVIPALACVEEEIRQVCGTHAYTPRFLSGMRSFNTFHTGEISNHVYGIAIDIDPDRNLCCGCIGASRSPRCNGRPQTAHPPMKLPKCWVDSFTKYGFYWLGNDADLKDTMHFEFLGDPDKILKRHPAG